MTGLTVLLSDDAMQQWGWRIPFLVAGPLGLVGLYLRLRLDESPAFKKLEEAGSPAAEHEKVPLRRILFGNGRAMLLCLALVAAFNITDYMLLSYMPTYLSTLGFNETGGLMSIVVVMIVLMALINSVGRLSDRVGRRPVLIGGSLGFIVLSVPSFLLIKQGGTVAVFSGLLALGLALVCYLGTDVLGAARAVPDRDPLRLALHRVQHLGVPVRRYDAAGDPGPDRRHRQRPDARLLHDAGRRWSASWPRSR